MRLHNLSALTIASAFLLPAAAGASRRAAAPTPVQINDNRTPAGTRANRTLTLDLRAGLGLWWPEGPAGPSLTVQAFGADTDALQVPSPYATTWTRRSSSTACARVTDRLARP